MSNENLESHSPIRTRSRLVSFDLGGLLDPSIDLSESLLSAQQLVIVEEPTTSFADPVELVRQIVLSAIRRKFNFLDIP